MHALLSDFLYAFRIFFKRPGLTLLAIFALAFSLGLSTHTFSILNGMFFKPLPYKDPQNLYVVYLQNPESEINPLPLPFEQFEQLRDQEIFEEVAGNYRGTINLSGNGTPKRCEGAFVTANFLDLLGAEPLMGRSFSTDTLQPGGPKEILLSHSVWESQFRSDPDIIGTSVRANGSDRTVVGVLPEHFHFPVNAEVWLPINQADFPASEENGLHVMIMGRLKKGGNPEALQTRLDAFFEDGSADREQRDSLQLRVQRYGQITFNSASQSFLLATISSVIFILLVSCANVANLLVGRALTRGREMAIRSALGATRLRILRQLLTESLVLSVLGGIGGLLYAVWAVDASLDSLMAGVPYWMNFQLDWRCFLFISLVILLTALVSGIVPAWQASKTDLNEMLKDTAHTSTSFRLGRLTRLLAVVQIAFSCALLFGAGLVTRNVYELSSVDPGYPGEEIFTLRMGLFEGDYPTEEDRDRFYRELKESVREIPGISGASLTSWIGQFGNYTEPFLVENAAGLPRVHYPYLESVSPDHFQTLGLEVLQGRGIRDSDTAGSPRVAVVNQAFAEAHFPGESPLGRTIRMVGPKEAMADAGESPDWEIVGVVPTVRVSNFRRLEKEEPIVYLPFTQTPSFFMTLAVRSHPEPQADLQEKIEQAILQLDPHLPVYFPMTLREFVDRQIKPFQMIAQFFLVIGLMSLFLAAIGIYGMLAFNVSRRSREIGIRMALGADTRRIVSQVLRQGFLQVALGTAIGSALAAVVGGLTRNFLLAVNPLDPSVYLGVLFILTSVAALAFLLPARRAARLSPMEALRYE